MSVTGVLQAGLNNILANAGQQLRIRTYLKTVGSVWDDDVTLTLGSNIWSSGIVFPVRGMAGAEALLLEQGKISNEDKILFMSGTNLLGSTDIVKIGLGSPVVEEYTIIPDGFVSWGVSNTDIFHKFYIRQLSNGSILGE